MTNITNRITYIFEVIDTSLQCFSMFPVNETNDFLVDCNQNQNKTIQQVMLLFQYEICHDLICNYIFKDIY